MDNMDKFLIILEWFLNWIFPQSASRKRLESLSPSEFSSLARLPAEKPPNGVHALFYYKDPLVKDALWLLKFKGSKKIAKTFGRLLYDNIIETISEEKLFSNFSDPIIIPIPSSKKRRRGKGWNQTEMLAYEIAGCGGMRALTHVLVKVKETARQVHLSREKRLINLRDCFRVLKPNEVKNRNIILLDDIVTTGSTLHEASKTLYESGARCVLAFTVAH